jgi:hypothetical protein
MMTAAIKLSTGMRFERLVVIGKRVDLKLNKWIVLCDCGTKITARASELASGHVKSCGCMRKEMGARNQFQHGMTKTPEHQAWRHIISRCSNPKNKAYKYYGGRGIECRFGDFASFFADLGPRPSPKHSVDRMNVNGHYEPGNCRWATPLEQGEHRTDNHYITWNGRTQHLSAWAREVGLHKDCLKARLVNYGWSVERALTEPTGLPAHKRMAGAGR